REALEILHRALWHHERPLQNVQLDANPRVLTRAQQEVGIGKDALYQDRARVRVYLAARRIACAAIRIDGAVGEDQLLRAGREAPGANRFADARRVLQILLLAHREGHADRIDLRDGGERPGVVGTDQVADLPDRHAHDPVDRRADLRESELDVRPLDGGARRPQGGFVGMKALHGAVVFLAAHRSVLHEWRIAVGVEARELERRLHAAE